MKNRWELIGCEPFSNIVGGLSQEQKHIVYENNYYELQKYKKLEEKIGIDLITLIKLQKQGYIYSKEFGVLEGFIVLDFILKRVAIIVNFDSTNVYTFYIDDYKKKWWLKEDKSE